MCTPAVFLILAAVIFTTLNQWDLSQHLDGIQGEREVANNVCGKVVWYSYYLLLTKKDVQFTSEKVNQFNREKLITMKTLDHSYHQNFEYRHQNPYHDKLR